MVIVLQLLLCIQGGQRPSACETNPSSPLVPRRQPPMPHALHLTQAHDEHSTCLGQSTREYVPPLNCARMRAVYRAAQGNGRGSGRI